MNITSKGIATIYNSNPLWIGSQTITIYCTDEQGLQSSVDIIFTVEPKVHIETISILSVQAYPNPAKDNVRISFTVAEPELYTITIVSMSGNIVMQQREWVANHIHMCLMYHLLQRVCI
jgi:hypothetical protein